MSASLRSLAQEQTVADGPIADDRLAFDHLCDHVHFIVSKENADTLADACRIAADRDELSVAADPNGYIAGKTQYAFCA